MCGNAALCSTRLAVYLELAEPGDLCLLTDAGVVPGRCDGTGDQAEIRLPDVEIPAGVEGLAPGEAPSGPSVDADSAGSGEVSTFPAGVSSFWSWTGSQGALELPDIKVTTITTA